MTSRSGRDRAQGLPCSIFVTVYTVGHSTRAIDEFIDLLRQAGVDFLVDVRRLPGSRAHPQFNEDALAASLAEHRIEYERIAELAGRRSASKDVPFETNAWWENRSFHNYADHALSEEFAVGLARLLELSAVHSVAVMCSEAVWWRCHRRIISDHLLAGGESVVHLIDAAPGSPAVLSAGAEVAANTVTYPAP